MKQQPNQNTEQTLAELHPVALVVGASRGIGYALVQQLITMPHWQKIYVTHRSDNQALQKLANSDDRLIMLEMECSDEQSIRNALQQIKDAEQAIGFLCYCAGVLHNQNLQPEKRLPDLTASAMQESFAVNAFGPALVMRYALPLLTGEPSRLVNISARVGSIDDNGLGGWYSYRAAKAAQNMFTRTACIEIGRRNKQFAGIAFHPGTTDTGLSEPFQQNVDDDKLFSADRSAGQLLQVIADTAPAENGSFKAWDGSDIRW